MNNAWFTEQLAFEPIEFSRLNPHMWIQRRKIQLRTRDMDTGTVLYTCESRKLTNEEYEQIQNQIEDVKRIVADLTDTAKYEEGYNAAMILLGQET